MKHDFDTTRHWDQNFVYLPGEKREIRVEYFNIGDPADPRLLMIHGWGMSPVSYRAPINALAADGWYVTAPSLPGFGHSSGLRSGKNTLERMARRVQRAVMEMDHPQNVPVVGHSMGAGIAAMMAKQNPSLARNLTLVCPIGAAGSAFTSWTSMFSGMRKEIGHDTPARILDAAPNIFRHPLVQASSGIAAKHADLITVFKELSTGGTPIQVVLAENDGIIAVEKMHHLYSHSGIEMTVVPGGHGWLLDHPERFAHVVDETQILHPEK